MKPKPIPKGSGRSLEYWQLRAVETVNPLSYYGRPWSQLEYREQVELMAYSILRMEEKVPEDDE